MSVCGTQQILLIHGLTGFTGLDLLRRTKLLNFFYVLSYIIGGV